MTLMMCRFDGWLVNIEKPFSSDIWNSSLLDAFLRSLKEAMGDTGELIWFVDSHRTTRLHSLI